MENLSVTQQIINYCKANPNTLFDVELMFGNVFQCDNFNNFRKYVSRAKEQGNLYEVGKGVYYIGKNPTEEDIQRAIVDFYVDNNYGMLSSLSLLYKYKLIEDAPTYVEIKCSVKRNKAIGDNKIIPTKTMITKDNRSFRELLEILSQQTKIECLENIEVLKELAKGYKDSYITAHLLVEYNRIAFVRLMTLLNMEGIENNIRNMLTGL